MIPRDLIGVVISHVLLVVHLWISLVLLNFEIYNWVRGVIRLRSLINLVWVGSHIRVDYLCGLGILEVWLHLWLLALWVT